MERDPFSSGRSDEVMANPGSADARFVAAEIHERQRAFGLVTDGMYDLWWDIPTLTHRQIDQRVQSIFRDLMGVAPALGVSLVSIRPLRECCGKKRAWSSDPLLGDPDQTLIAMPAADFPGDPRVIGWGLGDIVYRITSLWNAKHCDRCERRRIWLNRIFSRKK